MKKKKALTLILAALLSAILCFAAVACSSDDGGGSGGGGSDTLRENMTREENDFLEDDNRRPGRQPFVDNTPVDPGPFTAYRFETELAEVKGPSRNNTHFCTASSVYFSPGFSGNLALYMLGDSSTRYMFTSDKAVRCKLRIRFTPRVDMVENGYITDAGDFSVYANMAINGRALVDTDVTFDPNAGEAVEETFKPFFGTMVTLETEISIAKGDNVLEIAPATSDILCMDYIELATSAVIENTTVSTLTDPNDFFIVQNVPSLEKNGHMSLQCKTCGLGAPGSAWQGSRPLPALSREDVYIHTDNEDGEKYELEMLGVKYPVWSRMNYTLTLEGGATLEGGVTSGKIAAGSNPVINYDTPDGHIFSHWEDSEGNNLGAVFEMPEKDITIKPVFVEYVPVTIRLEGATLDGKNEIASSKGQTLDLSGAVFESQPEGTKLYCWYNVDDPAVQFKDASSVPVTSDMTLAPGFDKKEFASSTNGGTDGKLVIYPYNGVTHSSGAPGGSIRGNEASGEEASDPYWGYVGEGDRREMGGVYHWRGKSGALNNGFYFTIMVPYTLHKENTQEIAYTVQNFGDEEITLKLYQTNNYAENPRPDATSTDEFVLGAGETKTVTIRFGGFANSNILTTVELLTDGIEDLKIGMYQYLTYIR